VTVGHTVAVEWWSCLRVLWVGLVQPVRARATTNAAAATERIGRRREEVVVKLSP
jgi:hypothetical protein